MKIVGKINRIKKFQESDDKLWRALWIGIAISSVVLISAFIIGFSKYIEMSWRF